MDKINIKSIQEELEKETNHKTYYSLDFKGELWLIITKDEIAWQKNVWLFVTFDHKIKKIDKIHLYSYRFFCTFILKWISNVFSLQIL